jgi:predicted P-loop ATPase
MLVLNGKQGVGKSTLVAKLGGDWYSDSLSLSDVSDKTGAEKLQGYWIMEIGELAGMRKADIDKVKSFISRQNDIYRASFGRRATPHLRQCVFIGTTNAEDGYLRDTTGNRRFWNVRVTGEGKRKPWQMTDADVQQVWAEAIVLTKAGERLYLDPELSAMAEAEQREAVEHDDREGLVREYLDVLLPDDWDKRDIYSRREYLEALNDPTHQRGKRQRQTVCNMEIWCECFEKRKDVLTRADSYAISAIMQRIDGWEKSSGLRTIPLYGKQRIYARKGEVENK